MDLGLGEGVWPWVWLAVALLLVALVALRYRALAREGGRLPPGVGATRLVGLTGEVTHDVEPDDAPGTGLVHVAGDTWHALADGPERLVAGTRVRVVDVEGTRLRVAREDEDAGSTSDRDQRLKG